jgi:DNA-binding NtrC family response regulator
MPAQLQVKLLRALEGGEVRPVGSEQGSTVDIRVLAATNQDLQKAVASGQFREDLYYRINVISLTMPNLADRHEDIPLLAHHFLLKSCAAAGRPPLHLASATMDLLQGYSWPGNVRELRNVMERAVALAAGKEIRPQNLPVEIRSAKPFVAASWFRGETKLVDIERQAILLALKQMHGNRAAAARSLGISERSLYRKLNRHKLRDLA